MNEPVEVALLKHREKLLNYIQSKVHDPDVAEDVLQEGLLRAVRSAGELREEDKLAPWFYRVLNNAIIDTYRRRQVEEKYLRAYAEQQAVESASEEAAEICACFRELIPALKPEYGVVLEALDLSAGDPDKVAEKLNISRGNLKVRRHRARQALREKIEETCRTCAVHGCLDCTCELSHPSRRED